MTSKLRAFSLGCVAAALFGSAQAAVVTLDFEAIGLAAPHTGKAVGTSFSSAGLTFSANALAFHKGVLGEVPNENDTNGAMVARAGNFGYVRSLYFGGGFNGFRIDIAGKNYDRFALTLGVQDTPVEIFAYDANNNKLNTSGGIFQNHPVFAWTSSFTLVDGSAKTNIDHITFNFATRGLFAIDDLQFTEASPAGGTVPEPAGLGMVVLALAAAGVASRRSKSA